MNCEKCNDEGYFCIDIFEGVQAKLECECNMNKYNIFNIVKDTCKTCDGTGQILLDPYMYYCHKCEGKGLLKQ